MNRRNKSKNPSSFCITTKFCLLLIAFNGYICSSCQYQQVIGKARCGHYTVKSYADAHGGLCRKCHSNFVTILELEKKYGEDAVVDYWYGMILTRLPESKEEVRCFISYLIDFYQQKLIETPSKQNYIRKMLYMLNSIQEPFDIQTLR
jgi:hypothetical protein